jgi:hypothetical protein
MAEQVDDTIHKMEETQQELRQGIQRARELVKEWKIILDHHCPKSVGDPSDGSGGSRGRAH